MRSRPDQSDEAVAEAVARMVVFCQHGLGDPLVAPLMLDYVLRLQRRTPGRKVLFITEEPPGAVVPEHLLPTLASADITWLPLRYDVRGAQWRQRLTNAWRMVRATRRFVRGSAHRWLVGYLSYGGSYAALASFLGLGPFAVVCFEPHSRYMQEMGIWRPGSLRVRVAAWLERWQMRRASALVVPTTAVKELVMALRPKGDVVLQGITIDVASGRPSDEARNTLRAQYALGDAPTLLYVGKFGGIYHDIGAYLRFVHQVITVDTSFRFIIISHQSELDAIRGHALFPAVMAHVVLQPPVPTEVLHRYLSAGDIGVVAIPPTPSQVFRTPVKSAHYWAAGLPLLIPRGVSDDHAIASERGVGIVVDDIPVQDPASLVRAIHALLSTDRDDLRSRCVQVAMEYRDSSNMVNALQRLFQ